MAVALIGYDRIENYFTTPRCFASAVSSSRVSPESCGHGYALQRAWDVFVPVYQWPCSHEGLSGVWRCAVLFLHVREVFLCRSDRVIEQLVITEEAGSPQADPGDDTVPVYSSTKSSTDPTTLSVVSFNGITQ